MSYARLINPRRAALAGILAGVIATIVELLLWGITGAPVLETLFRDARLAAAIPLGKEALHALPDVRVLSAASGVHFALSIVYALMLAPAIRPLRLPGAALAGALYGLVLYALNMYGFTLVFPWFAATRDWITAIAHVVFGAAIAVGYKVRLRSAPPARP